LTKNDEVILEDVLIEMDGHDEVNDDDDLSEKEAAEVDEEE
jgi:hypothetical protein